MFRLFGFDVHVRAGFVAFLGLIVLLYQDGFGLWLAAGIAGFTLVHELGHAAAARAAGAEASISLDFLAGYTSFRASPGREIGLAERALITAAGPVVHIACSLAVLVAMGVNPLSFDSIRDQGGAAAALWWAGPLIGALNLIPVLPLDGGHLALTGLESVIGERALRVMAIVSVTLTIGGAVVLYANGQSGFAIFVAFLIVNQLQLLGATGRRKPASSHTRLVDAETAAWQTGRPVMLEPGQRLSPWFEAHRALGLGDTHTAQRAIVADLESPRPARWAAPSAATAEQLRAVVAVLPDALPHGNPYSERVLADVLLATGQYARAGQYAVESYAEQRSSILAAVVARAAAAMGDDDIAVQWLATAVDDTEQEAEHLAHLLAVVMDRAVEFARIRQRPGFAGLRARLPPSAAT